MTDSNEQKARHHVHNLKAFYQHLISYIITNIVLIIINLVVDPHHLWFYWVLILWGIAILAQAIRIFGPGSKLDSQWEERKVKEYLDKHKDNP